MPLVAKKKDKTIPTYVRMSVRLKKALEDLTEETRREFSVELAIAVTK